MEVSGKVKLIRDEQQISDRFKKRELVVTTEEQYPQHLLIEFVQDKTSLLDNFQPGDSVTVGINLRGREWQSPQGEIKYFNSIQGWRISKDQGAAPAGGPSGGASAGPGSPAAAEGSSSGSAAPDNPPLPEDDDDLPF